MAQGKTPVQVLEEAYVNGEWNHIQDLVKRGETESLHLDFKQKENPAKGPAGTADKKNLSKALSGFANADGGLIVWGVDARPGGDGVDKVQKVVPIEGLDRFLSDLQTLTSQVVSFPVADVRHHKVSTPHDSDKGVAVSVIPASDLAPHMATARGIHQYFRRTSSDFLRMEHYEVADLFGRRPQPQIGVEIGHKVRLGGTSGGRPFGRLTVKFVLKNKGRAIAHHPALSLGEPQGWTPISHYEPSAGGLQKAPAPGGWWRRWVGAPGQIVYPDDEVDVANVTFEIGTSRTDWPDLAIRFKAIAEHCRPIEGVYELEGDRIRTDWTPIRERHKGK